MSIYAISGLPEITDEEQKFLCDNPNTADIVDWVREYAAKATHALRQQLEEAQRKANLWDFLNKRLAEHGHAQLKQEWDVHVFAQAAEQRLANAGQQEVAAWGIPNSRPTERNPLMQVLLDKTSCQYPELLIPLYLHPALPATDGLEPVTGDILPKVGSRVLIHLGRQDEWVEHAVTGYYVWGGLGGNESLHRVFVRVVDDAGFPNARLLNDVRPVCAALAASKEKGE